MIESVLKLSSMKPEEKAVIRGIRRVKEGIVENCCHLDLLKVQKSR